MRILAFDTATRATTVALCDLEDLAIELRDDPPSGARPRHATRLMALIVELLERGGVSWSEVDRIGVGLGPGTFTGLRIGIATARALASARRIPLVGVSTLESLALNGRSGRGDVEDAATIVAVLDARRGEVFAAAWEAGGHGPGRELCCTEPLLSARAWSPDELAAWIAEAGSSALAIGDGAVAFRSVLARSGAVVPEDASSLHKVTAGNHCRLASGLRAGPPDDIRPEYLRLPDAEIARQAANR